MVKGADAYGAVTLKGGRLKAVLVALILLLVMLPAVSRSESPEEVKTVDATGFSPITGGNAAIARDAAINDAMRKAVEQAVGTLVSSETMLENYQILQDNVYTKTQGYVKSYNVINEGQNQQLYQVTIRAVVALGNIKNDLDAVGLLHAKVEKPRVLFMIAEQAIGHKYYTFWWWGKSEYMGETVDMSSAEGSLKESFLAKGFNVVDISGSMDTINLSSAFRVADLTNDGARQIGRKLNAEIVVKGKALAKEGPRMPGSNVGSYIADVTAEAIKVDNGAILASARGHGVSRHVSDVSGGTEALSRAGSEAADKLMDQILAKWTSGGPGLITLRLSGFRDYKKVADFKNALKKQIRGVQAVYQRRFENGEATFELDTKGTTQSVADDISRIAGFSIRVTNTTQSTIEGVMEGQ